MLYQTARRRLQAVSLAATVVTWNAYVPRFGQPRAALGATLCKQMVVGGAPLVLSAGGGRRILASLEVLATYQTQLALF